MTKSIVIYQSHHGTTKKLGEEINNFLKENNIESVVYSMNDVEIKDITDADIVFLGCWTNGLFICMQHPEKKWVEFAKTIPSLENKKVVLFTTYKLATGSMFKNMKKAIKTGSLSISEIKSKNGILSENDKILLKSIQ